MIYSNCDIDLRATVRVVIYGATWTTSNLNLKKKKKKLAPKKILIIHEMEIFCAQKT